MKIPYYAVIGGRGYWQPTPRMRREGFRAVRCGFDGPDAWRIAAEWNERWQRHRRGEASPAAPVPERATPETLEAAILYPHGSLGEAFARYRRTEEWRAKAPRTREDWWRGWKRIRKIFGDIAPATVSLEDVSTWRAGIETASGRREAHRAVKIWRALWKAAAAMHYCERDADPSLGVRNRAAKGRSATWSEGEAVRLAKRAWREGYRGLALAIAIAWDSQLSPVDVRTLTSAQLPSPLRGGAGGGVLPIIRTRTKSAEPAGGILSRRTLALLALYRASLGYELMPDAPLLRTRGPAAPTAKGGRPRPGAPFTRNSLAEEFRAVRSLEFGEGERRQFQDLRRSGAVEAIAGGASAEELAHGMGNTLDASSQLYATYVPVNLATLRSVADARRKGRQKLREE